jgi:hypothetical protein
LFAVPPVRYLPRFLKPTRRERAEKVRKCDVFTKYGDKARALLDALLDRKATEWRREQDRCLREIENHQSANES